MKHILTEEQWDSLWENIDPDGSEPDYFRIDYWNEHYKPQYNLDYTEYEANDNQTLAEAIELGYWGIIEGDQKHINWLILKL